MQIEKFKVGNGAKFNPVLLFGGPFELSILQCAIYILHFSL